MANKTGIKYGGRQKGTTNINSKASRGAYRPFRGQYGQITRVAR